MGVLDKDLGKGYLKTERKNRFGEYAKEKGEMSGAALMSQGLRDYYGPVKFRHEMRANAWVIDGGSYGDLVFYETEKDAAAYAKELKEVLKKQGFGHSDVWAERVVVRSTTPYASFKLKKAAVSYDDGSKFIIRMDVSK